MRFLACVGILKRGKVTLQQTNKKVPGTKSGPQVAVIGGSASGFFTASLLARAGCSVEVLERSDQLDPTPRTLIVTSHMRTLLGKSAKPPSSTKSANLNYSPMGDPPRCRWIVRI